MPHIPRLAALALIGTCLGMTAFGLVSLVAPGTELIPDRPSLFDLLTFSTIFMVFPLVGGVIVWRRPGNPIGWLLLIVGLCLCTAIFASEYAGRVAFTGADLPAADLVAWTGGWTWSIAAGVALPLAIMLFPDGRLPSPRWRPLVALGIGVVVSAAVAYSLAADELEGYGGQLRNPFAVGGAAQEIATAAAALELPALLAMLGLAIAALVARFRRRAGAERQQLKWLLFPASIFLIALAAALVIGSSEPDGTAAEGAWSVALLGLAAVPIGAGIAILRYRLYDIDLVIRRTLVYGALVAVLGAVYVALVVGLQTVLSGATGGTTLPVAVSTLATAALFGPVRRRVREAVDRRFYRSRYDTRRTLERFSARLRDEVDLDAVGRSLTDVAGHAVRPASIGVWLRGHGE